MVELSNHYIHEYQYEHHDHLENEVLRFASDGLVSPDSYSSYLWPDGDYPKPTGGPNGDGSL